MPKAKARTADFGTCLPRCARPAGHTQVEFAAELVTTHMRARRLRRIEKLATALEHGLHTNTKQLRRH